MTEDEKKNVVLAQSMPAAQLSEEESKEVASKILFKVILENATAELQRLLKENKPLVVGYKFPCPCTNPDCKVQLAIQISPYTEVIYDALRSKH